MTDRFTYEEDGHEAELTYSVEGDRMTLTHTGVPDELGGRGIGGQLVEQAIDHARANGLTIVPQCSYAKSWIDKHADRVEGVEVA